MNSAAEQLDQKARELFEATARGMGFVNHAPWPELHEDTREMYRREYLKRAADQPGEKQ